MIHRVLQIFVVVVVCFLAQACRQKRGDDAVQFVPKPKGQVRIDLPAHSYQLLTEDHPYTFEFSKYAVIKPDTFKKAEPHWIFVQYPAFNANIQLTYKPVNGDLKKLQYMIQDAHTLSYKHNVKAYAIQEKIYTSPKGKKANIIELEGEVPSQVQFFMTDSSKHYLRGALYFNTAIANDSLAPVIQYIKQDILHMINTMAWKQ